MSNEKASDLLKSEVSPSDVFTLQQGNSIELKTILEEYFTERAFSDGFVDATITSPPYADLKVDDYKSTTEDQIGVENEYNDYLESLRTVYEQVYDLTKPSGTLWVIVDTFKSGGRVVRLPWDIADVCENLHSVESCPACGGEVTRDRRSGRLTCDECGEQLSLDDSWTLHDVIIWDKERARPYSGHGTFRNVFEYILVFKKTDSPKLDLDKIRIADPSKFSHWWVDWPERYNPRGKVPENIWSMVTPSQGQWGALTLDHPAPFPPDLVERIVSFTTDPGDIVFDPFGGTGMTVAQATAMDRRALGIELSEEYCTQFPTLREEIMDRWEEMKSEGQTQRDQQQALSRVIWGLRMLVYSKKLFLAIRREFGSNSSAEMGGNTLFVRAGEGYADLDSVQESMDAEIHLVFDDSKLDQEMQEAIREYALQCRTMEPLNGFGIEAQIEVSSVADMSKTLNGNDLGWERNQFYVYHGSEHHRFRRTIQIDEWMRRAGQPSQWRQDYASKQYPPILSDIDIQVHRNGESPTIETDILSEPPTEDSKSMGDEIHNGSVETTLSDF